MKAKRESATENLDALRAQLERHAADAEYYQALESKSLKLQNRVSEIVKAVEFHGNDDSLMQAIGHYKEKDGAIAQSAPVEFLEPDERKALFGDNARFRVSLYKAWLFLKIADAVKAGSLNLKLSYKFRSLDDYLIPKEDWDANREEYLERAELVQAGDCTMTLDTLSATLHQQYEYTNGRILSGDNKHVRFHKDGRFHVTTPQTPTGIPRSFLASHICSDLRSLHASRISRPKQFIRSPNTLGKYIRSKASRSCLPNTSTWR